MGWLRPAPSGRSYSFALAAGGADLVTVAAARVPVSIQNILLRIPEIFLRFIHVLFLLLPRLQRGATFRLGVSASRLGCFTAREKRCANDQANELKVLHTCLNISSNVEARNKFQMTKFETTSISESGRF
jgi:hypothetical protein